MSAAPRPHNVSPSMRARSLLVHGHGVRVAGQDQAQVAAEVRPGHEVVADAIEGATTARGCSSLLEPDR